MPEKITIENASGNDDIPDPSTMRCWVSAALNSQHKESSEICVRIVDIDEMISLNSNYRGKAGPTNVLSFPLDLPEELQLPLLGDIVVCAPVVKNEALEQGKSRAAHWAHMLIHGTLHLLGYDHTNDPEAEKMEAIETSLITALGFPPPYENAISNGIDSELTQ